MNLVIVLILEIKKLVAKIRGDTARLRVEEGRWSRIERSERLCTTSFLSVKRFVMKEVAC